MQFLKPNNYFSVVQNTALLIMPNEWELWKQTSYRWKLTECICKNSWKLSKIFRLNMRESFFEVLQIGVKTNFLVFFEDYAKYDKPSIQSIHVFLKNIIFCNSFYIDWNFLKSIQRISNYLISELTSYFIFPESAL